MVASGLEPGMVAVAPVKLTLHLTFAGLFFASVVAFATWLTPPRRIEQARARGVAWLLLALIFVQIALGGLVAGSRAGFTFNTWPLMDGALVPAVLDAVRADAVLGELRRQRRAGAVQPPARRLSAAGAGALACASRCAAPRRAQAAAKRATAIAGLTLAQAALGIVTLLLVVPLWAGLAHQALAFMVLAMAVVHVTRSRARRASGSGLTARPSCSALRRASDV